MPVPRSVRDRRYRQHGPLHAQMRAQGLSFAALAQMVGEYLDWPLSRSLLHAYAVGRVKAPPFVVEAVAHVTGGAILAEHWPKIRPIPWR